MAVLLPRAIGLPSTAWARRSRLLWDLQGEHAQRPLNFITLQPSAVAVRDMHAAYDAVGAVRSMSVASASGRRDAGTRYNVRPLLVVCRTNEGAVVTHRAPCKDAIPGGRHRSDSDLRKVAVSRDDRVIARCDAEGDPVLQHTQALSGHLDFDGTADTEAHE